jgi:pyrroline-5-carboxylate reductase
MDKIGFIGLGNMGGALWQSLLEFGAFSQEEVLVSTRTKEKTKGFISRFPEVKIMDSNIELARESRTIFIGVKTGDVREVLLEIRPYLQSEAHLIIITGGLTTNNVAKIFSGKFTKIIPSLPCTVGESVTLVFQNPLVRAQEASRLEKWLNCLGLVKIIDEDHFEIGADLTSCAPAFIASIFKHFMEVGLRHSRFKQQEVEQMVLITLLGTARLLQEKKIGFDKLIARVATKGGITEEGLKVLNEHLPFVFDEGLEATLNKHQIVKTSMDKLYAEEGKL